MSEKKGKRIKIPPILLFTSVILYMEIIIRIVTCESFFNAGLILMLLFSGIAGIFLSGICYFFSKKGRDRIAGIFVILLFIVYAGQITYHLFFGRYLIIYSLVSGGVEQVTSGHVMSNAIAALIKGIPFVLLLCLAPIGYFVITYNMAVIKRRAKKGMLCVGVSFVTYFVLVGLISLFPSFGVLQSGMFDMNTGVNAFGLLQSEILDIKYNLLGFEQDVDLSENNYDDEEDTDQETVYEDTAQTETIDRSPNISDINFELLAETETNQSLKELNQYFADKEPTYKNEYTGMYKGYNLIHIVAEGFSPYAIHPELTPTLYKMQQEGFKFTNFYTPIWGVSTSDGEYVACTGLLPKSGVWSFYKSGENYMPYCLGNMFESIGVEETYAYHNNTHDYYHRDVSHPNMGYLYKGMGTGVEKYVKNCWPQSDLEMIAGSISDYLTADKQFHAYYMTVSGHMEYTKMDNMMSYQNWDAVSHLECSDSLKAYYACNIEFDKAMAKLLEELNAAGVADKTVISITPDHYPYGLEKTGSRKHDVWAEMLGHPVDTQFELYRSCFLLYCQGTENPPVIDKYCYHADVIPTLLNLFGFEYDSRLLAGNDIMSDTEGMVVFPDGSYITDSGSYSASKKTFTSFDNSAFSGEESKEEYILAMRKKAFHLLKVSAMILDFDYYAYVFE